MTQLYHRWSGSATVYDLTVAGAHEFFAGGILVHNCDWCLKMHKTIIPVGDSFWEQGTSMPVEVGEGDKRHTAWLSFNYETVTSPPLHPGCRCNLLPYNPAWEEGGIEAAPPVEPIQGALI